MLKTSELICPFNAIRTQRKETGAGGAITQDRNKAAIDVSGIARE
jgi:hypothetical protein